MNPLHHAAPMKEKHYLAELHEVLSDRGRQENMAGLKSTLVQPPDQEPSSTSAFSRQEAEEVSTNAVGDCQSLPHRGSPSKAKVASFANGAGHQYAPAGMRFVGPQAREKREWYNVMVHAPCHRQESFAAKNKAWFGGAGSVRGLVRKYESTGHLLTSGATGPMEPFAVLDRNRLNYTSIRRKTSKSAMPPAGSHPSAPCLTQTDTSTEPTNTSSSNGHSNGNRSTSNSLDSATQLQGKKSGEKLKKRAPVVNAKEPPLPPYPDEVDKAVPSAPPLSAPIDERFPTPPPPIELSDSENVPKRARPVSLTLEEENSTQAVVDTETGYRRGKSCLKGSPDRKSAKRKPLKDMHYEVYYSAVGEGANTSSKSRGGSSRDESDRSRMGDFYDTGAALGQMAQRLKHRESLNPPKSRTKTTPSANRHSTFTSSTGFPRTFNRYGEPASKPAVPKPRLHSVPTERLDEEVHDVDLDAILQNRVDRKVSYYRCPEPQPEFKEKGAEFMPKGSKGLQPVTSTPVPEFVKRGSKSRSRTASRSSHHVDLLDTKKALCFDSGNNTSSSSMDSLPRKRRNVSVRNFGGEETVYENQHGEVVFRTDAQRGYEFCSTISMRASDWNEYTVTRTRRELRTGRVARQQDHVHGKRVIQHVVWDEKAASGHYQQQPFDDTLYTVSYDGNSDDGEDSDSGFEPSRRYPPAPPETVGAYKNDRRLYITNAPIDTPVRPRDSLFCCFPVCR